MAIKDIFKVTRRTFVNPSEWLGYSEVKSAFTTTWSLVRELFYPSAPVRRETFDEAMQRQGLTEEDVKEIGQNYLFYTWIFIVCALFSLVAGFYLLIVSNTFAGFLLSFAVVGLFLCQAFRFNFWYFQIKHRKLGCTFDEWWTGQIKNNQESQE